MSRPRDLARLDAIRAEIERHLAIRAAEVIRRGALPRTGLLDLVVATHPDYLAGWFHRELCGALEEFSRVVAAGESPRLMIFAPPRHGKSLLVSQALPVYHLGHNPDHEVACTSYGATLAEEHSRRARRLLDAEAVRTRFPNLRRAGVDRDDEWQVAGGGGYKAVGVGGGFTGKGAHLLIVDDPVKDRQEADSEIVRRRAWEWYTDVASTRLAPGGGILLMMTRWHSDDLAGRILERAEQTGERWTVLRYPALAEEDEPNRRRGEALHPERYPREVLEAKRALMGERSWQALYQGLPVPETGGMFRRDLFAERYTADPKALAFTADEVWITADAASKGLETSDFHAIQVWAFHGAVGSLIDRVHERMGLPAFERTMDGLIAKWRPRCRLLSVLAEDAANGAAYLQTHAGRVSNLIAFSPTRHTPGADKGKVARARYLQLAAEAHQVVLPDPSVAPWAEDVLSWWCGFPVAAHDDDVDAASQLWLWRATRHVVLEFSGGGDEETYEDEEEVA